MKVVLGIDPGSRFTGFGVVRTDGDRIIHVSHGVIAPPLSMAFHERLGVIANELEVLFNRVRPDVTVIERVFLGKNADSAFKLGHARGLAVARAIQAKSAVIEYATKSVKKGITGSGNASKEQVQLVLFALLGLSVNGNGAASMDASDALALAFYHARNLEVDENIERHQIVKNRRGQREAGT
jgi:crossover junction endodeoxyribonuclease RuvC